MRLSEAIDALLIATRANGRSARTVKAYQEKLGHLLDLLGDVEVERITTDDLRRYVARMHDTGLSPYMILTRTRAMKRLFAWLEEEGRIEDNPARRIKVPRPKEKRPKALAFEDFLALLATTRKGGLADLRDRAIMMMLYDTGCRAGGLCGLRVQDVDLENGLAWVTEKGGKGRYVMFTERTAEALAAWLEVRPAAETDHVFVGLKKPDPLTPSGLWQILRRRAREAGVKGPCNPHAFRHGFAKAYLMGGGDLGTLADLMGHSSVEVTKDYYGVFSIEELQKKHDRHSPITRLPQDYLG